MWIKFKFKLVLTKVKKISLHFICSYPSGKLLSGCHSEESRKLREDEGSQGYLVSGRCFVDSILPVPSVVAGSLPKDSE
jgi:hypothetical protein